MLKNVVFDLDGTLWHNGETYIYAYNKTCDDYGITARLTDSQIMGYLTANFKELMNGLFPWADNNPQVLKKALTHTGEFVLNNPDKCLYDGVKELLATVSKKYNIYLSSNCPKAFAELFLEISDTKNLFTKVYTMEDGKKPLHLAEISAGGKTVFLGDSPSDRNAIIGCSDTLFCWAAYGYSKCVLYDYKINSPEEFPSVLNKIK